MKKFDKFIEEAAAKRCPPGQYYCFDMKKCKKIPRGYHVGGRGYLEPDEDTKNGQNGTSSNGNSNGSSSGNGGSGNGSNGGNGGGNGGS